MNLLRALFLSLSCLSVTLHADDVITLKTGAKVNGLIMDERETADMVTINTSGHPSIVKDQEIPKNTIQSILRESGESEPAFKLELPARSAPAAWYEHAIVRQIQPWLKKHAKSASAPAMQKKLEIFLNEQALVQAGQFRENNIWYTPIQWESRVKQVEAESLLVNLKKAIADKDFLAISRLAAESQKKYSKTSVFSQIATRAKDSTKALTMEAVQSSLTQKQGSLQGEYDEAVKKIQLIVNQTPSPVPLRKNAKFSTRPYWYKDGAAKPDFATADVLSARLDVAEKGSLITSHLNADTYWSADECEANEQLKFFYTTRNVPKKRLNENEVKEVVRLFRTLASIERTQADLPSQIKNPAPFLAELKQIISHFPEEAAAALVAQ